MKTNNSQHRYAPQYSDKNKIFFIYHLPVLIWMALIFTASSISQLSVPNVGISWTDKIAHFFEFGIFTYLLLRSLMAFQSGTMRYKVLLLALFFGVLWGALDEFHQRYVPGRSSTFGDLAADSCGVIMALTIFSWIQRGRAVKTVSSME